MKIDRDERFAAARRLFPHTEKIVYFNSASYGPFCTPVQKAIEDNIDLRVRAEKDDSHDAFAVRDSLRQDFADLIGARKQQVGIGLNTSFGLNIAAFGLPLKAGDEVIVSEVEFPAAVYTWRAAAEARGLKLKFISAPNRYFDIDSFKGGITGRTAVLALSWVQFFNGYRIDLEEVSSICKKHGIYFVVDGIQGMGVEPINVCDAGVDVFASGCQKWMLSPQGCGFFYLSDNVRDRITPPFMSWLGADWQMKFQDLFHYDKPYFDSAERFELGYYAVLNILGMDAAVQIFKDLGVANIKRHNRALIDRLAEYVRSNPYYRITCSMEPGHRSSIFTFTCDHVAELHRAILDQKIILVNRENSIRVSVHLFNDEADVDRLIEVLDDFSRGQGR
ncbi:MAG: aminotransferase class V-fold PLP-dependent enzyme [Candidatus Zixiibacteriota bacterium]|nr:MAG: aminotransferase class V-fold PLP-dependent enzyme [candidate division Zixibacteria bacterium]